MTELTVSVVIVSRGRPAMLQRCLTGVSQLQSQPFEVVVVADPAGVAAVRQMPFAEALKLVEFDDANISAARNLGLTHAAGEMVAFIDDDAVPEPDWLYHLVAPAAEAEIAACGGFVRGRNGISYQWTAQSLTALGDMVSLDIDPVKATILHPPKGRAIKTEGTNMAFRRSVLVELGGFDPAFEYFLDETDLNMRLARAGHATAIVPRAQVHHGFAESAQRNRARVPRDLFDIGASWAVFHRKHLAPEAQAQHWAGIRDDQRRRLLAHMVSGMLEPGEVRRLIRRLDEGYEAGKLRTPGTATLPAHPTQAYQPFPAQERTPHWIRSRPIRLRKDLQAAADQVAAGNIVSVLSLSLTTLYHQLEFSADGVWVQKGGLFGRSDRSEPVFRFSTRNRRLKKEKSRVAGLRGLGEGRNQVDK